MDAGILMMRPGGPSHSAIRQSCVLGDGPASNNHVEVFSLLTCNCQLKMEGKDTCRADRSLVWGVVSGLLVCREVVS